MRSRKREAGGDMAGGEVLAGVADQVPDDQADGADDDHLPDDGAEHRVGPGQPHAALGGGPGGHQAWVGGGLGHRAAVSVAKCGGSPSVDARSGPSAMRHCRPVFRRLCVETWWRSIVGFTSDARFAGTDDERTHMGGIAPCLWFDGRRRKRRGSMCRSSRSPRLAPSRVTARGCRCRREPCCWSSAERAAVPGTERRTPAFAFSPTVSFSVPCADQAEVDHYWAALTAHGGAPGQCGWLTDRFGVSWQIVPAALERWTAEGRPRQVGRMMAALMGMSKLDVAALEAAFAG